MTGRNIALCFLGVVALVCVAGGIWLTSDGKDIPQFIVGIGTGAVGVIGGLIAPGDTPVVNVAQPPVVTVPVSAAAPPPQRPGPSRDDLLPTNVSQTTDSPTAPVVDPLAPPGG